MEIDETTELDGNLNLLRLSAHGAPVPFQPCHPTPDEANDEALEASQNSDQTPPTTDDLGFETLEIEQPQTQPYSSPSRHGSEEEWRRDLSYSMLPSSVSPPGQQTGDNGNGEDIVATAVQEGSYRVAGGKDVTANESQSTPSTKLPLEEANLRALSEAMSTSGSVITLPICDLLTMITFLQELPLGIHEPPSYDSAYWAMKDIAHLAKSRIEERDYSTAVSIYEQVITDGWGLGWSLRHSGLVSGPEHSSVFSQILKREDYLDHEATVFQIYLADFFKRCLCPDNDVLFLVETSVQDVIKRLRRSPKITTYPFRDLYEQQLQSLSENNLKFLLEDHELWYDLLDHAFALANCFSMNGEFETAETLFQIGLNPRYDKIVAAFPAYYASVEAKILRRVCKEKQRYKQHQQRWNGAPYKTRVRPWNTLPATSLRVEDLTEPDMEELNSQIIIRRACQRSRNFTGDPPSFGMDIFEASGFRRNENRLEVINLTETARSVRTSSTKSYKYGVTLSDSGVPGMDLSKYLV
jgi:hypothetical protein